MPKGMKRKSILYELLYWEHLKISHLLDPMHIFKNVSSSLWTHISYKRRKSCLPGEILFLQILKRSISQDKKIEERMATLFHLKKAMSHGFWRKKILIWKSKLYWVWRRILVMGLIFDVASILIKIWRVWNHMTISTF